jgi:hypothetical protein
MLEGNTGGRFFPKEVGPGEGEIKDLGVLEFGTAILNPSPGFSVSLGDQRPENHEPHLLSILFRKTSPCRERV